MAMILLLRAEIGSGKPLLSPFLAILSGVLRGRAGGKLHTVVEQHRGDTGEDDGDTFGDHRSWRAMQRVSALASSSAANRGSMSILSAEWSLASL